MNISYEEIGALRVTFPAGGCEAGKVCKIDTSGSAAACVSGDKFCGVVESVSGSTAGVQIHGFAKVSYTGTAPSCGFANLAANGAGGVAVNSNGRSYLVVKVDTSALTAIIEL